MFSNKSINIYNVSLAISIVYFYWVGKFYIQFVCHGSIFLAIVTSSSNIVDVLGHKYVFGPFQTHFYPRCARAKISLSRVKNIFMPANINFIVILL